MNTRLSIRKIKKNDYRSILGIAKGLPGWFTEKGVQSITTDMKSEPCFIATKENNVVGFVIYAVHEENACLKWIGVKKKYQRQEIGTKLLMRLEKHLSKVRISEYVVETLGPGVDYAPYEQTRSFYEKNGFETERIIKQDNPECEELLIMKKRLGYLQ
jgi:ribosomal protein S18 acetylase RimI-like enzyme